MRHAPSGKADLRKPLLLEKACRLAEYLQTLSPPQLADVMSISPVLAQKTHQLIADWTAAPEAQSLAIDSFLGDIYSGLHANDLSNADRDYADQTLRILSGLYGILRPYDGICPYRLEMGYMLPDPAFASLYAYWGDAIAASLPPDGLIVNLAAVEYAQTVTRYVETAPSGVGRIISPKFLTIDERTGKPAFVVVHAKIARGAFARWLITTRAEDASAFARFDDLGYRYVEDLSAPGSPAYVCETFGGTGRSIRLTGR